MGLAQKLRNFAGFPDYDSEEYQDAIRHREYQAAYAKRAASSPEQFVLIRLDTVRSGKKIIDQIQEGIPVIFSIMETSRAQARRLLDFVCGGLYAYDGWVERIGVDTYLLLPIGIDLISDDE